MNADEVPPPGSTLVRVDAELYLDDHGASGLKRSTRSAVRSTGTGDERLESATSMRSSE
jgi:hypothetical protein